MDLSRDEFYEAVRDIRTDISGVHTRLDKLNDRVRTTETKTAVLEERSTRNLFGAGGAGAGAGLILAMAWEWFKAKTGL